MAGEPMLALACLAGVGALAQWMAWRLRVPVILVLLVAGLTAGPVTGVFDPDEMLGDLLFPAVSLAVGIILFDGSLHLGVRQLRAAGRVSIMLITVGASVSFVLTTVLAMWVLDRPLGQAAMLGAILMVTGPTVIGPLLRQVRPKGRVGPILQTEGILIDPIGAVMALLVFEVVHAGRRQEAVLDVLGTLAWVATSGLVFGIAAAALVWVLLRHYLVPDHLTQAVVLGTVVMCFALADYVQEESGLMAVTVMGLALANQRKVSVAQMAEFNETLQVLLVSALFLIIAARLDVEELRSGLDENLLLLVALVVVVRPAAVLLSTIRSGLRGRERAFLAWIAPRGIVAAAVSSVFAIRMDDAGIAGGDELAASVVVIIIGTITLAGLTARPLARRLELAESDPDGILIIGAHAWGRQLAGVLEENGVRTVIVERDRARATTARLAGSDVHFGSIISDRTVDTLDTDGIGHVLAITGNDELNAIAAERLRSLFGSGNVWRLTPDLSAPAHARFPDHMPGRLLFEEWATDKAIEDRVAEGATIRATKLTRSFDWAAYRERNPEALVMILLRQGSPVIVPADQSVTGRPDDVVIALKKPAEPVHDEVSAADGGS